MPGNSIYYLSIQQTVYYNVDRYPHWHKELRMKTVQMTIDEELLSEVDDVIQSLRTTRSAFIRGALQLALHRYHIDMLERQQAEGYARYPSTAADVDEWAAEQVWGES